LKQDYFILKHTMSIHLLIFTCLLSVKTLFGQHTTENLSPIGTWLTTDDETGEAKSHIRVYEQDGKQHGKIIKVLRESLNHICDLCPGERKNQPILGMVIIENMTYKNGYWHGGHVLYPKQGKWYNLKYWLKAGDSNTLVVRGSFGPFFRTQYWKRVV